MNVATWFPSEASHNLSPRMIDSRRVSRFVSSGKAGTSLKKHILSMFF